MDSKGVSYIVGGVVALVVINRISSIFSGSPAQAAVDQDAAVFDDPTLVPELYDSTLLDKAIASGAVTAADVADTGKRTAKIANAVLAYYDAKGLIHDDEYKAITAVGSLQTWTDLLAFTKVMNMTHGVVPGPYGGTFLGDTDKAAIVRLVVNLRASK